MMLKIFLVSAIQLLTTVPVQSSFWPNYCRPWRWHHFPWCSPGVGTSSSSSRISQPRRVNPCQGTTILRGYSGVFSSPNYPQNYQPNSNCVWKIISPPGTKFLIIHFEDFHLEYSSTCSYDYVEIRNGNSPTSHVLKKFCRYESSSPKIVTGPSAFIRFRSDSSVNYKGFRAVYHAGTNTQDLCDTDYENTGNSSYIVCNYPAPWIGALQACQNMGADLVKIETEEENTFLFNNQTQHPQVWIGLTRGPDNHFYWSDGSRPGYSKWANGQPDNWRQTEHCGHVRAKSKYWNDFPCNKNVPRFVCERSECKMEPLANASSIITASSSGYLNYSVEHGVFGNSSGIWCPQSNSTSEWLQVDLGTPRIICGFAVVNDFTVGNLSSITWYQTFGSLSPFKESPETRNRSMDRRTDANLNTSVIHDYRRLARYIRFIPIRSINWPCMKVQIYGNGNVVPPKMVIPLMNKTVEHARAVELRCIASSYPFPRYSWTKNGSSVIPNGILNQENTVLRISPVSLENEGFYTCCATSSVGSVSSSAYLTVHSKPKDLIFQTVITGLTGSDVVLTCESAATPIPNVTWTNDNINISSGRYSISTAVIPNTNKVVSNITIRNVTIKDIGFYKCQFLNLYGSIDGTIMLDVVDECSKVVFDFEVGSASLKDWGRTGTAFNNQPTFGDNVNARRKDQVANNQGEYWIGTYENRPDNSTPAGSQSGDFPQGSMISPEFHITGANVSFFIGGGGCRGTSEAVQLLVGGHVVRTASGICKEKMMKKYWNLQPYIGRKARLRLIDFSSAAWGHISFDEFKGDVSICQGCTTPLGMTTGKIPDFAVTASSMYSLKHAPKDARLYSLHRGGYYSTWSPKRNRVGEWIQVDLGTVVMVTKIATQGRTRWPEWVTKYTLKYSVNGTKFEDYQNNKVFRGNSDSKTVVENVLLPPIQGRVIRLYPQSWKSSISMKMELYGCPPKRVTPTIVGLPKHIARVEGSSIFLMCVAHGFPYITYTWFKHDAESSLKKITSRQGLHLSNITEKDSGVYRCIASNDIGNDLHDVKLDVQYLPYATRALNTKQVAIRGKTTTLTCQMKGSPKPVAVWLKNSQKISSSRRVKISSSISTHNSISTTLTIHKIEYEDKGFYTCEFANLLGVTNSSGILLVHGPPQFTLTPKSEDVVKGDDIKLSCAATSVPTPQIRWKFNGKYLDHSQFILNSSILVIKKVKNSPLFEGNYTCEASNSVGQQSSTAQLKIYERPWLKNLLRSSVSVPQGQTDVLHCSAAGDPTPEIEWSKDGIPLKSTKRILFKAQKMILLLQHLRTEDSGLYKCVARNILGNVSTEANVHVFGQPKIDITRTRKMVYTLIGNPVNVMCLATNPLPIRYSWTKDGENIQDSANVKVYKNLLVVVPIKPKDFGTYVCNASNIAGSTNFSIELKQRTKGNKLWSVPANKSKQKGTSSGLSIWIPLLVVVIILLAAVVFLGYRYLQLRRSTSCSKTDTFGLVCTYDKMRDESITSEIFVE